MRKLLGVCVAVMAAFGINLGAVEWREADFSDIKMDARKGDGMTILIIGANGSVAKIATEAFLRGSNVKLKLFLRHSSRLNATKSANPSRVDLIEGDATDKNALKNAMSGVNIVYANLHGDMPKMAEAIIAAMKESGVKRLVWISSAGVYNDIYQEIPDYEYDRIRNYNPPHRQSVKMIEASKLDYTIIRPQWFSWADEVDYELTRKGEPLKNPSALISRKSIAHLVVRLCLESGFGIRESFGINKPAR